MADALISHVLGQLASYGSNEVTLVVKTRQEVLNLTDTLIQVKAVLADADEKQVKNKAVRVWLDNLKQVVYDADDVLDEWHTRTAISQLQGSINVGTRKKVLSYLLSPCFCIQNVIVRYDISQNIRDINTRLDGIAIRRTEFGLEGVYHIPDQSQRLTSSVVDVSKIHGRDQAKEDMMYRLLGQRRREGTGICVIAIVGMGGIGKTTLAKLIFNEERVDENFKKMWVCVSDPFNLVSVAKAIIKEATGRIPECDGLEEVHKYLCASVKEKQFLLVLDDIWTEDPSHWNQLKVALDGGARGSRIIVTTRNRVVANIMVYTDSNIHYLGKLSDEDSWLVLKDVALFGRDNEELETFEKMGKEIVSKCKGVPLAITILASLLCGRTKQEWKNVLVSDLWEMPQIEQFFLPSFFLSYYSLPAISKQCFLYCALFPKDTIMKKDLLIKLWMAQGFFGLEQRIDLERIGEENFRILALRSFFQDFKKDSDSNITSCKMHDLVHDFAMYVSQNECFCLGAGDTVPVSNNDKIRHLFVADDLESTPLLKAKNLRTLLLRRGVAIPIEFFNKFSCLRTMILPYGVLPNELENMIHLRYIDLSSSDMHELPETICNLYNLQVLALNDCKNLNKLPEKIGKLSNLRYLEIERSHVLRYFPKSFAKLSSLRSLSKFIVSGADNGCTIGDLQLLNNLQGALELKGLSRVTDEHEVDRAELKKKNLRELVFDFEEEESGVRMGMKKILVKLEPHADLEVLKIIGYPDSQLPDWVRSCLSLANMVEVRLYGCEQCTELPAFGKLASLKTLVINGMGSVTRIGHEFYGFGAQMAAFPKLDTLIMKDMMKLEEWEHPISKDSKIMPLLVHIRLLNCSMLRALPCLGNLELLEEVSMDKLLSVKYIGNEFYGFRADNSLGVEMIAFLKLKVL